MKCLHPNCPAGNGKSWDEIVAGDVGQLKASEHGLVLGWLKGSGSLVAPISPVATVPQLRPSILKSLLRTCPCLYLQLPIACSARAVVHLCELALGEPITSHNVYDAFLVQHPDRGPDYKYAPQKKCKNGGKVMEAFCSEVLSNAKIPAMELGKDRWPIWKVPGHILLNEGKMGALRAFGDILIPCGPTNLVISVKSEVARERLLYSSNAIEGAGFGFFKEPQEFWNSSRLNLYKRMGFSAIYMPNDTHSAVIKKLEADKILEHAVNVNGTALYRPLSIFADDMNRIVGRHTLEL